MSSPAVAPMRFQQLACESPLVGGIVVAVDGSAESYSACAAAVSISAKWGCPVHVVSVIPPITDYRSDPTIDQPPSQIEDLRIQIRRSAIRTMMERALPANDWTEQVTVGRVPWIVVEAAERRGAKLIIVGHTKHAFVDRMLGGETALQIIRLSRIPVLAVTEEFDIPRTAVAAVDFNGASTQAARVALSLLGKSGTLYLVHVEPTFEMAPDLWPLVDDTINTDAIVTRFRNLVSDLRAPSSVIIETIVLYGRAAKETLEFADRVGADLLAVGTQGPGRFERFLLGSVSTSLIRNSRISTLATPEEEK